MFPTPVGMNRRSHVRIPVSRHVFPTPVGMNRPGGWGRNTGGSVPHTRGDEPYFALRPWEMSMCSPHPWG